ncbi:MAG: hypothetical protein QNJ00_16060 [Woeseiaceae bacterium]|nr:hypothetical protein [Woeseiaceae bacterium]
MDNMVLVVLASFSSAAATYLFMQIKNGAEKIAAYQPMDGRQRLLTGTWTGESKKAGKNGDQIDYKISLNLEASMRQLGGYGKLEAEQNGDRYVIDVEVLTGGFHHGQFMIIEYRGDESQKSHFGSIIGALDESGTSIDATMTGFTELLGAPGTGELNLRKV